MLASVRVLSLVMLGAMQAASARAADAGSFEEAARDAAQAPELDALLTPYLDDCAQARREIDRARCRGMQKFVREQLPNRRYTMTVDSPNVVSVSPYDAAIKGYRVRLVGCLTCEKPLAGPGGQKRFVTLKVPDKHAGNFGAASKLADASVSFDNVPAARAWENRVRPNLRAEFVFKPTGKSWSYREHRGVAFAPVASRIFDRCTGEVLYSSPPSQGKVAVDEEADGCKPEAPASASRSAKEGAPTQASESDSGGRDKENLDGRPEKLGAAEITQALKPVNADLRACDAKHRTTGSVDLEFEVPGQGGTAQAVRAKGQLVGTEVARCLLDAVRKVRFPEFQRASQTFSFSVRLQGQ